MSSPFSFTTPKTPIPPERNREPSKCVGEVRVSRIWSSWSRSTSGSTVVCHATTKVKRARDVSPGSRRVGRRSVVGHEPGDESPQEWASLRRSLLLWGPSGCGLQIDDGSQESQTGSRVVSSCREDETDYDVVVARCDRERDRERRRGTRQDVAKDGERRDFFPHAVARVTAIMIR